MTLVVFCMRPVPRLQPSNPCGRDSPGSTPASASSWPSRRGLTLRSSACSPGRTVVTLSWGRLMIPQSRSLYPLTGLRFVAAAMIVLWHISGQFGLPPVILGGWPLTAGVSFFFILSGFILTHAHSKMAGGGKPYSFYVSRIARIWPAHVACFLLLFVLVRNVPETGTSGSIWAALANIFIVQAWAPETAFFQLQCCQLEFVRRDILLCPVSSSNISY